MANISLLCQIICVISLLPALKGEIIGNKYSSYFYSKYGNEPHDMTIHKVSLTQKGYIQFLKYMTEVPALTEFTFCIWMRSSNLTHSHPLFSYSLHEEKRLIRVWISDHGRDINMEILENEVFKVTINLHENHWHHICPSWNSNRATWSLYVNGKQKDNGVIPKLRDIIIPSDGDIVVGQEYTDFDKGLDDGIEGDIFGFNFILSSISATKVLPDFGRRRQLYLPSTRATSPPPVYNFGATIPVYGYQVKEEELFNNPNNMNSNQISSYISPIKAVQTVEVPEVLSYFKASNNRIPKGLMDIGRSMLQNIYKYLEPAPRIRVTPSEFQQMTQKFKERPFYAVQSTQRLPMRAPLTTKRIYNNNELDNQSVKSLGLLLVELSYNDCALGKGSPINDGKVLISWTKTPVRVFGGAILKTVPPFCRKFR